MNRRNVDTYIYENVYPRWVILIIDSVIVILSTFFAFLARNGIENPVRYEEVFIGVIEILLVNIVCFYLYKIPSRVLRYSSFPDFIRILLAQTSAYLILLMVNALFKDYFSFPSEALSIVYVLSTVLLISLRILVKVCFEFRNQGERDTIRVMIYTMDGKSGDIVRRLRGDTNSRYRIRGFITDNVKMKGRYLMAIPVYINNDKLLDIVDGEVIDAIVVDSVKMDIIKSSDLIDKLFVRGIKLITLSPVKDLNTSESDELSPARDILIEDLLQKEPIQVNLEHLSPLLRGKRIMITGAAGSIGRELVKLLIRFQPGMFILVDQAETPMHEVKLLLCDEHCEVDAYTIVADITNKSRMENLFELYRPQYVFHLAAYKHIPMLELDVSEAIQVNLLGTCNLANLAVQYGVENFLMTSTDKATLPNTIMGASKRIAEIYIQALARKLELEGNNTIKFSITRFGNVLDSSGSVLLYFKQQIAKKENLVVTHPDVIRHFLTVHEVACLILEASSLTQKGAIYAFDSGRPVKIYDLAKRMISLSGLIPGKDIKIEISGLRPGEKLSEKQTDFKDYGASGYDKIFIVPDYEYKYNEVNSLVKNIIEMSYEGDISKMIANMKELIPDISTNKYDNEKPTINN